jgi:hypothetical protein
VEYEVPIDDPFYPLGEITPDPDPKAIRWVMPDDGSLNVFGIYTVTFFGDANDRPAITDASEPSQRLDGDRDGKEGGNFQFTFIAGAG